MTKAHLPFLLSMVMSGLISGGIALPIGLPTLRLRGVYFGIATLAFAEAMKQIVLEFDRTAGSIFLRGLMGSRCPSARETNSSIMRGLSS